MAVAWLCRRRHKNDRSSLYRSEGKIRRNTNDRLVTLFCTWKTLSSVSVGAGARVFWFVAAAARPIGRALFCFELTCLANWSRLTRAPSSSTSTSSTTRTHRVPESMFQYRRFFYIFFIPRFSPKTCPPSRLAPPSVPKHKPNSSCHRRIIVWSNAVRWRLRTLGRIRCDILKGSLRDDKVKWRSRSLNLGCNMDRYVCLSYCT